MDLRLWNPRHTFRLAAIAEISEVRKIGGGGGSHQVMRLVLWCDGSAIVISAVPTMHDALCE